MSKIKDELKKYLMFFLIFFVGFLAIFSRKPEVITSIPYLEFLLESLSIYSFKFFLLIIGFFMFKSLGVYVVFPIILYFLNKLNSDEEKLDSYKKIFSFIWWFVYIIISLSLIVGFTRFATSIGLIGLGISLAFQKPILNIVGWFNIVSKQLYKEGDRIEVYVQRSRAVIRGDVKEINLFHTVLDGLYEKSESKSGKANIFPNEFILSSEIRNYSRDSNYILNEIYLNITKTSDYKKARDVFEKSIRKVVIKYSKEYIKKIKKDRSNLDKLLKSTMRKSKRKNLTQEDAQQTNSKKEEITQKSQDLDVKIKMAEELSSELVPKIQINITEEGAIKLIGQYLVPYTLNKQSKTEIYLNLLDKIKNDEGIEIYLK